MSLIDKKNINYLSAVEQFFLSLKDSGLALSAADYHLISQWEERGIPLQPLCRVIEQTYLRSREKIRNPRQKISLAYLRSEIEQEFENKIR